MAEFKGVGKKLAIYVPREDEFVIKELEKAMEDRIKEGFRTSLSFELVKALKEGLTSRGLNIEKLKQEYVRGSNGKEQAAKSSKKKVK
jgi:hypothetical protein